LEIKNVDLFIRTEIKTVLPFNQEQAANLTRIFTAIIISIKCNTAQLNKHKKDFYKNIIFIVC